MTPEQALAQLGNYKNLEGQRRMINNICYKAVSVHVEEIPPAGSRNCEIFISLNSRNQTDLTVPVSEFLAARLC